MKEKIYNTGMEYSEATPHYILYYEYKIGRKYGQFFFR